GGLARAGAANGERVPEHPLGRAAGRAAAELAAIEVLSPGSIETFADCPIRWLVERWLRPEPLEPAKQSLARGSYAHELLRGTLERLAAAHGSAAPGPSTPLAALAAPDATTAAPGGPPDLRAA